MKTTFVASPNFKLFAGRDQESFYFYREKSLLWKKKLPAPETRLLGLANNGLLLVETNAGLLPYYSSGEEPLVPIEKYRPQKLEQEGVTLGPVVLEELGNGFVVERRSEHAKASESFFGFLKKGKGDSQASEVVHELVRFDVAIEKEEMIWRYAADKGKADFRWAAARNLDYVVVAEQRSKPFPQRSFVAKMLLFQPKAGRSIYEVELENARVMELAINLDGVVVARIEYPDETQYLGIKTTGDKFFITPPNPDVSLRHLGEKFLILEQENEKLLHFKNFQDKLLFSLDLKVLDELEMERHIFFRSNDDPVLFYQEGGGRTLQLTYTTLDHLQIQYKSWLLEVEQKKAPSAPMEDAESEKRAAQRREELMARKGRALSSALDAEPSAELEAAEEEVPFLAPDTGFVGARRRREDLIKDLERLKLKMVTGDVSKDEGEKQKAEIEKALQDLARGPAEAEAPPAFPVETALPVKKEKPDVIPLEIPGKEKTGAAAKDSPEKEKVEKLLEKLEERFINGEISEKAYNELKAKYDRKLKELS